MMWRAIVAALKAFAALIGMKDRADARKAGQQEQQVATLNTTIEAKKRMDDANAAGPRTSDDVDRSLRNGSF
jgi:mannose-6-phosphate isomerase class I